MSFFPRSTEDEIPRLPPELQVVVQAHQTLARDGTGAADLWISGRAFLDEHGVTDREERRRWLKFWMAISQAIAEAAARRREDGKAPAPSSKDDPAKRKT